MTFSTYTANDFAPANFSHRFRFTWRQNIKNFPKIRASYIMKKNDKITCIETYFMPREKNIQGLTP